MNFFTPQRYVDFNSDDPDAADKADEAWEQAIEAYQHHLATIRPHLSDRLWEFAEQNLHDARYLGFIKAAVPKSAGEIAVVGVECGDELLLLLYVLSEEPTLSAPVADPVFSDGEAYWLYDEVGVAGEATFCHEILLSTGKVLSLIFVAFDVLRVSKDILSFPPATSASVAAG